MHYITDGVRALCDHQVVCDSADEAAAVLSTVKQLVIRPNYSSPPRHGASVAAEVLTDPELMKEWQDELLTMALRIVDMRSKLRTELERIGAPGDWAHIEDQVSLLY